MTRSTLPSPPDGGEPGRAVALGRQERELGAWLGRLVEHLDDARAVRGQAGDLVAELEVPRTECRHADGRGEGDRCPDRAPKQARRTQPRRSAAAGWRAASRAGAGGALGVRRRRCGVRGGGGEDALPSGRSAARPARPSRTGPARPSPARRTPDAPRGTPRGGGEPRPSRPPRARRARRRARAPPAPSSAGRRTRGQPRSGPIDCSEQRAHALEAEAQSPLDRPEGHAGALGDLGLGQAAEVGELDRLALDVGDAGSGRPGPRPGQGGARPPPRCRAASGCPGASPRNPGARTWVGVDGSHRSPGGGRSRGARYGPYRAHRRTAQHSARRPGTRPERRLRLPHGRR